MEANWKTRVTMGDILCHELSSVHLLALIELCNALRNLDGCVLRGHRLYMLGMMWMQEQSDGSDAKKRSCRLISRICIWIIKYAIDKSIHNPEAQDAGINRKNWNVYQMIFIFLNVKGSDIVQFRIEKRYACIWIWFIQEWQIENSCKHLVDTNHTFGLMLWA